jgi:hypothetical protein
LRNMLAKPLVKTGDNKVISGGVVRQWPQWFGVWKSRVSACCYQYARICNMHKLAT